MNLLLRSVINLFGNRGAAGAPRPGRPRQARWERPRLRWRPSPATRRMIITAALLGVVALALVATAGFWVNWWWFGSAGYQSVLARRYAAEVLAFGAGGLIAAAFFAANWLYALRRTSSSPSGSRATGRARLLVRLPLWLLTLTVLIVAGAAAAARWQTWVLVLNGGSFGLRDPIFGHDAGFYVFRLPALRALQLGAIALLLATTVMVAVVYAVSLGLRRDDLRRPPRSVRTHVLALVGGLLLLTGAGYLLANYQLLSSSRGAVYGVGYTDANVDRWVNYALAALSAAAAALLLLNAFVRRIRWLVITLAAWAAAAVVLGGIVPAAVQQTLVEPSELARERPYIANNIALTRAGFGIEEVEARDLQGQGEPDRAALSATSPTFDNIRLWDYRVVRQSFQQFQSFVPYYRFLDIDVDRYLLNGQLRQVVLAARELDTADLPSTAQTWVNRHLIYTHGYGAVVSAVSEATSQGLPRVLAGGIPPEGTGALAISRPEIYFGELDAPWVAVDTDQEEVNGIPGDTPTSRYEGAARGSIALDNSLKRVMLAIDLRERRMLLSNSLGGDARVLLRRGIVERATSIAPFLAYDPDPYLVIAGGRLTWVIDAYTTSDQFPGATPIEGINYIRHSVKVTIDAYDGTVTFYRTGTPDPIADAYGAIFGDLFKPIGETPPELASHFRYPERLFDLQADAYASYHVADPSAFYNGEDRWEVAKEEVEGPAISEHQIQRMESYYVTLPLPDEPKAGFGLVLPFTPNKRQNMTAWMAGQTDEAGVPRLVVYRFPRQRSIFGPEQIEARINSQPDISEQITLLDQAGSRVIRGNLLVLPVGETVLYAQPLYVLATSSQGASTELQFVILATNDRVVMRATLPEALAALVAGGSETDATAAGTSAPGSDSGARPTNATTSLAERALAAYERGQAAVQRGDWASFGKEQATLETLLRELNGGVPTGAPTGTPGATAAPAAEG